MENARLIFGLIGVALTLVAAPASAQDANILSNPSLEVLNEDGMPTGWFSNANTGTGYEAEIDRETQTDGAQSIHLFSVDDAEAAFGNIAQSIDATAYRGHRLRLTASAKAGASASQHTGLWFRVDKADGSIGFFDNMRDRPISENEWQTYTVEGTVDPSAARITIGILVLGEGEVWLDNVELIDLGPDPTTMADEQSQNVPRLEPMEGDVAAMPIGERGVQNLAAFARLYGLVRWFHPSDAAVNANWDQLAISSIPDIERSSDPAELAEALRQVFMPLAPTLEIVVGSTDKLTDMAAPQGLALEWQHLGLGGTGPAYSSQRVSVERVDESKILTEELPGGLSFRLPLYAFLNTRSETLSAVTWEGGFAHKPESWTPSGHDRTTRLASITTAWSLLSHFYPYWDVVDADWDVALARALTQGAQAADDEEFQRVLERLISEIDDGHGAIVYPSDINAILPIDWEMIDGELVITAVADGIADIEPGMTVTAIKGTPSSQVISEHMDHISGSDQYSLAIAQRRSRFGLAGDEVELSVSDLAGQESTVTLSMGQYLQSGQFAKLRPQTVKEVDPGIFYVDLSRINQSQLDEAMVQLTDAEGIVIDLRGYLRVNTQWISQLADQTIRSAKFLRPQFTGPDGEATYDLDGGWTISPTTPRLTENIVFLTNASAISFAESVLGTVKENNLGTIVGAPTAGANGNASAYALPGGYGLRYTGMLVLNRDDSQHHLIGVVPDVLASPTREGVAAGRDEVFEVGLQIVTEQASELAR